MMNTHKHEPVHYSILVAGQLDARWQEWFEGMAITPTADGDTLLTGPLEDQAQLYGVLKRINNLGLRLISINPERADAPDSR